MTERNAEKGRRSGPLPGRLNRMERQSPADRQWEGTVVDEIKAEFSDNPQLLSVFKGKRVFFKELFLSRWDIAMNQSWQRYEAFARKYHVADNKLPETHPLIAGAPIVNYIRERFQKPAQRK